MCNGNALAKLAAKSTVATGGGHWKLPMFYSKLELELPTNAALSTQLQFRAVSEDARSHAVSEAAHSLLRSAPTRPAPKQIVQQVLTRTFDQCRKTNKICTISAVNCLTSKKTSHGTSSSYLQGRSKSPALRTSLDPLCLLDHNMIDN